jgi:uncharacterized protein
MNTKFPPRALLALLCAGVLLLVAPPAAPAEASSYDTFVQAVATDRSDQVRALLARGMDPNTVDPNGDPVLLVAARAGWQPTVDALLGAGAKVDAANRFGDRPIMVAALGGHVAIMKTLLMHGAELDGPGWTPLIYAASSGQTEAARYLLDAGAKVNAVSPNGTTALMMAVRGGHDATVELLLTRGAEVNRRNDSGATALEWAVRGGFDGIARALRARGATS